MCVSLFGQFACPRAMQQSVWPVVPRTCGDRSRYLLVFKPRSIRAIRDADLDLAVCTQGNTEVIEKNAGGSCCRYCKAQHSALSQRACCLSLKSTAWLCLPLPYSFNMLPSILIHSNCLQIWPMKGAMHTPNITGNLLVQFQPL